MYSFVFFFGGKAKNFQDLFVCLFFADPVVTRRGVMGLPAGR